MNLCGTRGNNSQQSPHHLQLYLLIPLRGAFANFIDNGIDQFPRQCSIALWSLFFGIEAVIRMISVQQAMRDQLLHVVENLLRESWYLGIESQLHDTEILVRTQHFILAIRLHLL